MALFSAQKLMPYSLTISELNTTKFPLVSAFFSVVDSLGNYDENASVSDFRITDNGLDVSPSIVKHCLDSNMDKVSVTLILDQSASMDDPLEDPTINWVKEGAISFLNSLKFGNGTICELIGFSTTASLLCPFTSNKDELINTISLLKTGGGTNYNDPFLSESSGAIRRLQKNTPLDQKRIIIFLTDGNPDGINRTRTSEIIKEAKLSNVQVFTLCVRMKSTNEDLSAISYATGGNSFNVETKVELNNIYKKIALSLINKKMCYLEWAVPLSCKESDLTRNFTVTYKKDMLSTVSGIYNVPSTSLANIDIYPKAQYFGNPKINETVDKEFSIKANNSDLYISGYEFYPSSSFEVVDWDIDAPGVQAPPILIPKGNSKKLLIRLNQIKNETPKKANLHITANPCDQNIDVFSGSLPLKLLTPNGGEIYSSCDSVNITWVAPSDTNSVDLFYKNDNSEWSLIKSFVRGGHYLWRPPFNSDKFQVKVEMSKFKSKIWEIALGGIDDDSLAAFDFLDNGRKFYIAGNVKDSVLWLDNKKIVANLNSSYFAILDNAGKYIWSQIFSSTVKTTICSALKSSDDNIFIVADATPFVFGVGYYNGININRSLAIAKYSENGPLVSTSLISTIDPKSEKYKNFEAHPLFAELRNDSLIVCGYYTDSLTINDHLKLPYAVNSKFTAVYNLDLTLLGLRQNWMISTPESIKLSKQDKFNDQIVVQYNYSTQTSNGVFNRGGNDVHIQKYSSQKLNWGCQFGGPQNDSIKCMVASSDDYFVYIAGQFKEKIYIDSVLNIGISNSDIFISKYTRDGFHLWTRTYSSPGEDEVNGICLDSSGYAYIVGKAWNGIKLGALAPDFANKSLPGAFLIKLDKDGKVENSIILYSNINYPEFKAWGSNILYNKNDNILTFYGVFSGSNAFGANFTFPKSTNSSFESHVDPISLSPTYLRVFSDTIPGIAKPISTAWENKDCIYYSGSFVNSMNVDTNTFTSYGKSDAYFLQYSREGKIFDTSDSLFAVVTPELIVASPVLKFDSCLVGDSLKKVFYEALVNNSEAPVAISSIKLGNTIDYKLIGNYSNIKLLPHEHINLEIQFTPRSIGTIKAGINIETSCNLYKTIDVSGISYCKYDYVKADTLKKSIVNLSSQNVLKSVFTNSSSIPMKVLPKIVDDPDGVLEIISPLQEVLLAKGEKLDVTVKFSPKKEKEYSAAIVYETDITCVGIPRTNIVAYGDESSLEVNGVNWGKKRLATKNPGFIKIENLGTAPVEIDKIEYQIPEYFSDGIFNLNTKGLNLTIAGGDSLKIPTTFIPKSKIYYSSLVYFTIKNNPKKFSASLIGEGIRPEIEAVWECPNSPLIGNKAYGKLTIRSKDNNTPLTIYSISLLNNEDYKLVGNNGNISIPAGQSKDIDIEFSPKLGGIRSDKITIVSDAADGPDINPKTETYVDFNCDALDVVSDDFVAAPQTIVCSSSKTNLKIKNLSAKTELKLLSFSLDPDLFPIFKTNISKDAIIPPLSEAIYEIEFNPTSSGKFNSNLSIETSFGKRLGILLEGVSYDYSIRSSADSIAVEPGATFLAPIYIDIDETSNISFDTLAFRIDYNRKMISPQRIVSSLPSTTWTMNKQDGYSEFSAKSASKMSKTTKLCDIEFKAYLCDTVNSEATIKTLDEKCPKPTKLAFKVGLNNVCFLDGRLVQFTGDNTRITSLSPNPNSAGLLKLDFTLAIEATTRIELVNSYGDKVAELTNEKLKAGAYSKEYNIGEIASGVYFIRFSSGPIFLTKELIIVK
jgi:Mg-chelatase subunit ChlD